MSSGFIMLLQEHLRITTEDTFSDAWTAIDKHLPAEWLEQALAETGIATLRKRRLPMQQVIWLILGIALMRNHSIADVAARLDIALPGKRHVVAPSALSQARQRLGAEPLQWLFQATAKAWQQHQSDKRRWRGLALYALDGVVWRTPDTPTNREQFGGPTNQHRTAVYPEVRMACLLDIRSRLLVDARFDRYVTSEYALAQSQWASVPDQSVVIIDKGFYSAALLLSLQQGEQRHWLIPARANARSEVVEHYGDGDVRLKMRVSPQARKAEPTLPSHWEVRAITRSLPDGSQKTVFTSLDDPEQWPAEEVFNLYRERWEIELAYGELKTEQLQRAAVLRSQHPDGIAQELWAMLLIYNLIRYEMVQIAQEAGVEPNRISFIAALRLIENEWLWCAAAAPGSISVKLRKMREELTHYILPERRRRQYPRVVKTPASKFMRKKNAVQSLN